MLSILIFPTSVTEQISRKMFFWWRHSHCSGCGTAGFSHPHWRFQWCCVHEQPHQTSTIPHTLWECRGQPSIQGLLEWGNISLWTEDSPGSPFCSRALAAPPECMVVRQCRLGSPILCWSHSPSQGLTSQLTSFNPQTVQGSQLPTPQPLLYFTPCLGGGRGVSYSTPLKHPSSGGRVSKLM